MSRPRSASSNGPMNSGVILRTRRPTSPGRAARRLLRSGRGRSTGWSRVISSMNAAMVSARTARRALDAGVLGQALRLAAAARSCARPSRPPRRGTAARASGCGSPGSVKISSKRSLTKVSTDGTVRKFAVRGRTSPPHRWISASPPRRSRCRRGGSGRCSAWGRRPRRACREQRHADASLTRVAPPGPRRGTRHSACSGSVSWNSSTRMRSNFAGSSGGPAIDRDQHVAGVHQQILEVGERVVGLLLPRIVGGDPAGGRAAPRRRRRRPLQRRPRTLLQALQLGLHVAATVFGFQFPAGPCAR